MDLLFALDAGFYELFAKEPNFQSKLAALSKAQVSSQALNDWLTDYVEVPAQLHQATLNQARASGVSEQFLANHSFIYCADPVQLMVTHNGIICRGNNQLTFSQPQAQQLTKLFNDHFSDAYQVSFEFTENGRGFMGLSQVESASHAPEVCFSHLQEILGKDIASFLPQGKDRQRFHQILTEAQMLMHQHAASLSLPIDGIWIYGQPIAVPVKAKTTLAIYTDSLVVQGAMDGQHQLIELHSLNDLFAQQNEGTLQTALSSDAKHKLIWLDAQQSYQLAHYPEKISQLLKLISGAIDLVNQGKIKRLMIQWQPHQSLKFDRLSRWCLWRNHKL